MKACPHCGRLYPDEAGFCPEDGQQLTTLSMAPVAPSASDPRMGVLILSRYQVRRVVADGGMGRVYEAFDVVADRNVAVKLLHADVATDEVAVERFKREFQVSQQLPHEHIVEVFDFQPTPDGSYALVMEFLYGEELRNTIKREKVLAPARVVRMLSQLAIGLDGAHSKHLVHRDLKPDNIFLCQTRDGDIVKILDFGSVKDKAENAKKLTVMGTTIGSPFYMAPEQAQGLDTLDHRADVWALAAIAYECLTGEVPFKGTSGPAILLEIFNEESAPPKRGRTTRTICSNRHVGCRDGPCVSEGPRPPNCLSGRFGRSSWARIWSDRHTQGMGSPYPTGFGSRNNTEPTGDSQCPSGPG